MKNKVVAIILLAVTVALLAIACGGGSGSTPAPDSGAKPTSLSGVVEIAIKNFAFDPSTVTVKVGTNNQVD